MGILAMNALEACTFLLFHGALTETLFPGSTTVVNLNPQNFDKTVIQDKSHWAVDLYAAWCPHCQVFAPKWEVLARKYGKEKGIIMFGALNCAEFYDFCNKLGVQAYPDLRVWHFPSNPASNTFAGFQIPVEPLEPDIDRWLATQEPKLSPVVTQRLPPPVPAGNGSSAPPPMTHAEPMPSATTANNRLHDAEVALLFSFRQGVFLQSQQIVSKGAPIVVLKPDVLVDLLIVLDFISKIFPSRHACEDLGALAAAVRRSTAASTHGYLEYTTWSTILDSQSLDGIPPEAGKNPSSFWRLCRTYTCGLWTMFHLIMAGSSQRATMSLTPSTNTSLAQQDSLSIIRTFVARFFGCTDCVQNFLRSYDTCQFGRCNLVPGDTKSAALWLWAAHNNITARVAAERKLPVPAPWPPITICPSCWANGLAVYDRTYDFLRKSYWGLSWVPGGNDLGYAGTGGGFRNIGIILVVIGLSMVSLVLCAICYSSTRSDENLSHGAPFLRNPVESEFAQDIDGSE